MFFPGSRLESVQTLRRVLLSVYSRHPPFMYILEVHRVVVEHASLHNKIRMTQTGNMHTDALLPGILSPFDCTAAFVDFTVRKALGIHRALFAVYVTMCRTHPNTAFFILSLSRRTFSPLLPRKSWA